MPRVKKGTAYHKRYTEENVGLAVDAVKQGMSKKQASVIYGVPLTTIIFQLSEKFVKINHGPSPILTSEEELTLCRWLDVTAKKGFPRRKDDIAASVKEFLDIAPRKNPFKNNTPGDG